MKCYNLTKDAENDLREIARYTLDKWGKEKLQKYRDGLKVVFNKIGRNEIKKHQFSKNLPELLVIKYNYHFIFYLPDSLEKPVIIGVIHERRNIVERLAGRLS
jgi:toxin ParE1/3/4